MALKTSSKKIDHFPNTQGGSSQSFRTRTCAKEEEAHTTHSFYWRHGNKKPICITCNKAGTVLNTLQRSKIFKEIAEKNKGKELVIKRKGKAVPTHFPCCLIKKDEPLIVKFIKAGKQVKRPVGNTRENVPSDKLVTFHLATRGGREVRNILHNTELKKEVEEISVYAYKGETVKQALKRDGRLCKSIFVKHCVLSEVSEEDEIEMSNPVDDLDGKSFRIVLHDKSSQPESQSGSLDDAYVAPNESQTTVSDESQDIQQQGATSESPNAHTPEETATPSSRVSSVIPHRSPLHKIHNSEKMLKHLCSQFENLIKQMKNQLKVSRLSDVQNLFRADFGKNVDTCFEMRMMYEMTELGKSVCQVRTNGTPLGSGFLLFDRFVLTNGHVINNIYDQDSGHLREPLSVTFSFVRLDQRDPCETVQVKPQVAALEYSTDSTGCVRDWALLELCPDQALPDGLLKHFGFVPPGGGIFIIGHPDGGVKKIDPCLVIPLEKRFHSFEPQTRENPESIQMITGAFFHSREILSYDTCFYFGSSGSPIFDEHYNVVAMHSGGYHCKTIRGQDQRMIEYGYALSHIIEQILFKTMKRGRLDVLRELLSCEHAQHHEVMKKIVSRNISAFQIAFNNSEVANDESLKTFFDLFSENEEPVPMDTD
ncbi:protein FAM111A-like isoform X2 [Myripristis murdjan]|uniref:protein FAM111A-like isoform X2 n=1 Tax=Myripristis murdjan TaxID=586833 RepID=UPI0011761FDB|nr:protein FAM111A-like isoform X2 [Myripristis murdjan]